MSTLERQLCQQKQARFQRLARIEEQGLSAILQRRDQRQKQFIDAQRALENHREKIAILGEEIRQEQRSPSFQLGRWQGMQRYLQALEEHTLPLQKTFLVAQTQLDKVQRELARKAAMVQGYDVMAERQQKDAERLQSNEACDALDEHWLQQVGRNIRS